MTYRLHPEAGAEHKKQVTYYEDVQGGLGRRYHAEFQAVLLLIHSAPQRYRIVHPPDIRSLSFEVFRFSVIYREFSGDIQVLAIAHHRRHPGYWLDRQ